MDDQIIKTLDYYKRLPYTLRTEPLRDLDDSNYWTAEYLELRGCKTDGNSEAEAVANLQELFDEYILTRIESGNEIPEPVRSPVAVEELWIVIQRKRLSSQLLSSNIGDTQQTSGEMKPETAFHNFEEIAA